MLSRVEPLTLEFLNRASQAWIEMEYNRCRHDEINETPLDRFLRGPNVSRQAPDGKMIRQAFTVLESRIQRQSDGTIQIKGRRFEIPSRFRHFRKLYIRYQTWDFSTAYLVDERTDTLLAKVYPQDKTKNAHGHRRTLDPLSESTLPATKNNSDPVPPLLRKLMADYAATGLPPAYIPKEESILTTNDTFREDRHEK